MTTPATPAPAVAQHPELIRFPLMEQPVVGAVLAFIAGLTNAWTLAHAGTFSTVQSGNVVSTGFYLVNGDWTKFWFAFISVLSFGVGSAACGVLMTTLLRRKISFTKPVLVAEAVILAVLAVLAVTSAVEPQWIAWAVSFVAGAQGNAFHKNHGMLYGNVAVTFVVQMAFNFLVQSLFARSGIMGERNIAWAGIFFLVLFGFAAGGAAGFAIDLWFNGAALAVAALLTVALAFVSVSAKIRSDPTPGGSFA